MQNRRMYDPDDPAVDLAVAERLAAGERRPARERLIRAPAEDVSGVAACGNIGRFAVPDPGPASRGSRPGAPGPMNAALAPEGR